MNPILGVGIQIEQEDENSFREASREASEVIMNGRNRLFLKACNKCRGDLYLDEDAYGVFTKCMQCGRIFEAKTGQSELDKVGSDKMVA